MIVFDGAAMREECNYLPGINDRSHFQRYTAKEKNAAPFLFEERIASEKGDADRWLSRRRFVTMTNKDKKGEAMEIRDAKGLTEAEFLAKYDPDKYPKPSLTADILVFRKDADSGEYDLLLIQRKGHPFMGCWALPGGFAERNERIEDTAARELEEETCVTGLEMELVGVYSKPGRDPRGWTVSAAFMAVVNGDEIKPEAADDANAAGWGRIKMTEGGPDVLLGGSSIIKKLAFDHYEMITDAVKKLT